MATTPPPVQPAASTKKTRFGKTRLALLFTLAVIFAATVISWWTTRDAAIQLASLRKLARDGSAPGGRKTIVDVTPWQTAQTLATMAKSLEEVGYAREAERLADHEVDQAFASALRAQSVKSKSLTGDALALSQKVTQLESIVKDDNARVKALTANPSPDTADDLEILKAQLGLDNDILNDAQDQLALMTGDQRSQVQQELSAHEATVAKYDEQTQHSLESASNTVKQHSTLANRIQAWTAQNDRYKLIQQARQLAQTESAALSAEYAALQPNARTDAQNTSQSAQQPATDSADHISKVEALHQKAQQLQLLSIYNDRIQTDKQLITIYEQWSAQVQLQHRLLLHLILESIALIALILLGVVFGNRLVRHLLDRPSMDPRRMQTLRTILELSVQMLGFIGILLVVFGPPRQVTTVLGLATAGLTVALQDFILAFLGWFVLMGRNGLRIGDSVEINGVAGEVADVGLFRTTIMETGSSTDQGYLTGRSVTFLNKYAVNGQYFNFSTEGQWMWDEISVNLPDSEGSYAMIQQIHKAVLQETEKDAQLAEAEWKRASKMRGLGHFAADAQVNLRPAGSGVEVLIRYVTRAGNRFNMRNRLYQRTIDLMRKPAESAAPKA